jgi:hypothetical protein
MKTTNGITIHGLYCDGRKTKDIIVKIPSQYSHKFGANDAITGRRRAPAFAAK